MLKHNFFPALLALFFCFGMVVQAAAEEAPPETCVTADCHATVLTAPYKHEAVSEDACDDCHNETDDSTPFQKGPKHRFEKIGVPGNCVDCHDAPEGTSLHKPAKEGKCLDCHKVHSSDHLHLLKYPPETFCGTCHKDILQVKGSTKVLHASTVLVKGCRNCHEAHASKQDSLLKKPLQTLCLDCHNKPYVLRDRWVTNIKDLLTQDKVTAHGPVAEGECTACHEPHVSKELRLLKGAFVPTWYGPRNAAAYALCYECHDENAIKLPETKDTEFRDGKKNLHYVHVLAEPRGRSCVACHNVHAAAGEHYLANTVSFFGYAVPLNYESTDDGGKCLPACHESKSYDREKKAK